MTALRPGYADFEPLLTDRRVEAIADKLSAAFRPLGLTDDTDFVTFIQPPTVVEQNGVSRPIPEVACFAVISDNPRSKGRRVMTQASVWLQDWRVAEIDRGHYVSGGNDPAFGIFRRLCQEQIRKLQDLRELND